MTATIEKFLSKNARRDRVAKFEELSKGKSKEEVREMEMSLLKPDAIPDYVGEARKYIPNSETTVKLVFRNEAEMELVGKHLSINTYIEPCISDIKIIIDLFTAIERGEISYNKKSGQFAMVEKGSANEKKPPLKRSQSSATEKITPGLVKGTGEPISDEKTNPLRRFLRREI